MWNDLNTAFETAELEVKLPIGEYVGAIIGCSFTDAKQGTMRWFNFDVLIQVAEQKELIGTIAKESLLIGSEKNGFMEPNNISLAIVKTIAKGAFGDITGMDFSTILATLPTSVVDTTISFSIKENFVEKKNQTYRNFYLNSASRADFATPKQAPQSVQDAYGDLPF
jgi:hypothetical protein